MTACSLNEAFIDSMSSMPNQAASVAMTMNGTQTKPAFCSHSLVVAPACKGPPPMAPNTPAVMTSGMTNWPTLTPRLPRPAFMASAWPFSARGKKKLMLAIDEAKLPPPRPQSSASAMKML